MSIDTSEFLDVLMEDSLEALSEMETSLLELDNGGDDSELINTIFRGAHSIKGGSGMLGLEQIAGFTHLMETLLDEVREGERKIDMPIIGLLLECVDALRGMFDAVKDGGDNDAELISRLVERLEATLENREPNLPESSSAPAPVDAPMEAESEVFVEAEVETVQTPEPVLDEPHVEFDAEDALTALAEADSVENSMSEPESPFLQPSGVDDFVTPGWAIQFMPDHDLYQNGVDPLSLFQQLSALGGLDAKPDINVMPGFSRINPEQCYLSWDINLITDAGAEEVRKVFAPVSNQCELIIEPLQEAHANQLRAIIAEQEAARQHEESADAVSYLKESMGQTAAAPVADVPEPEPVMTQTQASIEEPVPEIPQPPANNVTVDEPVVAEPVAEMPVVNEAEVAPQSTSEPSVSESSVSDPAAVESAPVTPQKEPTKAAAVPKKKAPAKAAPKAAASNARGRAGADRKGADAGGSIRVSTQKIDALINMAGELVITQAMLAQLGEKLEDSGLQDIEQLRDGLAQLERNSRELQDAVMSIRMLPISFAFSRFPRMIRDLATKLNKKVKLVTTGEQTELDKTVMEKIGDPLVHLVRNAFDHGIEMPDVRKKAGKDESGTIELNAYHQGGNIVIEVVDDGKGLDKDTIIEKARERGLIGADEQVPDEKALELIFEPGFSTAEQVSDLSGRGVGMDVVRRNIRDLGGHIELESEIGKGTRFTIRLPLTLAILDGQLVTVGSETFIVPLISIVESLQIQPELMKTVAGQNELYHLRDEYIPVVKLNELFDIRSKYTAGNEHDLLVVVEGDGKKIGLQVDDLQGQQQAFIKSLETNFKQVSGVSGATILGDGTVSLILDAGAIVRLSSHGNSYV